MTLGMGLVVLGLMAVYQLAVLNAGTELPDAITGSGQGLDLGFLPNSLLVFVPIAAAIILGLRTRASAGCCSRSATTRSPRGSPAPASGRCSSPCISCRPCSRRSPGFLVAGLVKTATVSLVESSVLPSVAAAVIGGTSIMGGRGGYAGTIVGALDPDGPDRPPDRALDCPRRSARCCSASSSSPSRQRTRG